MGPSECWKNICINVLKLRDTKMLTGLILVIENIFILVWVLKEGEEKVFYRRQSWFISRSGNTYPYKWKVLIVPMVELG